MTSRKDLDESKLYTFRKLSRKTYVLDLNSTVRRYLKTIGYARKCLTDIDVWTAAVPSNRGGRWGRTVACGATEAEVRRAVGLS